MPLLETKGAASAQGFGEFAKVGAPPVYIEDVFQTWLYTGTGYPQTISNGLALGDVQTSLVGKTLTNLGGSFDPTYPMSKINDGIVETANAANMGFVPTANGFFDVYVDMGSATVVTGYLFAPQGDINSAVYNTPTAFNVKASNDASTWATIATFTSISVNTPNWNAGSYRPFLFSNSTGYRYWRFENTTKGSAAAGVSISEWQIFVSSAPAPKGGLVWIKSRSSGTQSHVLQDTARGVGNCLSTNDTNQQFTSSATESITAFNSTGFSLGINRSSAQAVNTNGSTYASWTFCKQPKFFDVVTYTGNGVARTISHNLGSVPGCIIIKDTSGARNWNVYHRSIGNTQRLILNDTTQAISGTTEWNSTTPTATAFTVGTSAQVNQNGFTYVAYLFAHDAGGFGLAGTDNVISCGSYTGNGSAAGPTITLGYEPQWVLVKSSTLGTASSQWSILDNMRGSLALSSQGNDLFAQSTDAENTGGAPVLVVNATGFNLVSSNDRVNGSGQTYIYIAIRRGPMKVPTDATKVYSTVVTSGTGATSQTINPGFTQDSVILRVARASGFSTSFEHRWYSRLRGNGARLRLANAAQATQPDWNSFTKNMSFVVSPNGNDGEDNTVGTNNNINHFLRRAPGFFDEVCYTGTGSYPFTINHNLGVAPELMIFKRTNTTDSWWTYAAPVTAPNASWYQNYSALNTSDQFLSDTTSFTTAPTATAITTANFFSPSGGTNVVYLFASCPGVSKIGSYTGTGNTLQINCGFTGGAKFVLIKRTDSTGEWYYWDSARGIVAGNDPYLMLNNSYPEVTNTDWVDTHNPGFEVSNAAGNSVNINTATYLFLAIA